MKKESAYERIQRAMRERDRELFRYIRKLTKLGMTYDPIGFTSVQTYNSLHRLQKAGKIRWSHRKYSGGYVAVEK